MAQYTAEKINHLGGKVVTLSDSGGMIHDPAGIDEEKLAWVKDLKNGRRGRISEYVDQFKGATFEKYDASRGFNPLWDIDVDCAFPCATQNEINAKDAANLLKNNVGMVTEGANMPSVPDAADLFTEGAILYGPSKAANAGGVAVSGLEMSQNSMRISWSREELDKRLHDIMIDIHGACRDASEEYGTPGNYVNGANIAGFKKVADSMLAQGLV